VLCVAAVVALCWRMLHGVDFTDESFYAALPVRFALGDRPFVDELNIAQTAGLLIYPFVKLYTLIAGDATGIFLFLRTLMVVLFGLVGWSAYALARTCSVPRPAALLIGTMCMCFLPYGIPGLSYNTLGMGLLATGLFVAARALLAAEPARSSWRTPMFWAGFAHGAAAFAYASLVLAAIATAIAVAALSTRQRLRATGSYVAGGLAFAAVLSPLFVRTGMAHLRVALAYSAGAGSGFTPATAWARILEFVALHPELPRALIAIVASMILARRFPLVVAAFAVLLPVFARGSRLVDNHASLGFVACLAVFGPLLAVVLRERRAARVLVFGVVVPSAVAAGAICLSSSNGVLAAGVGLYPAAIVAAILLVMFIVQTVATARWPAVHPYVALAPAVALAVLVSCLTSETSYYRDGPRSAMTARVTDGPALGLYTTPGKAHYVHILTADIATFAQGKRVLFIYDLPIGYLIAYRRPMVSSSWTFALAPRFEFDVRLFKKWAKPGQLVVVDRAQGYPLDKLVEERCNVVLRRDEYTVYYVR
jgi:hypothetical protein